MSLKNEKLKTPSVLAFERKLCNSDGLMYSGRWDERENASAWRELAVQHKDVRGTISNRLKNKITADPLKLDAEIQKPNLQSVDVVALPFDADTLKLAFTLRVLGRISTPSACNIPEYQRVLEQKIGSYFENDKSKELALRYAQNLANGRILWRNRLSAEQIEVRIRYCIGNKVEQSWEFNGHDFCLNRFSNEGNTKIADLADLIFNALKGKIDLFLEIETFARVGKGQEVYPSQELVKDVSNDKERKSKLLYQVNGVAAMHSQKVGNALRTIDTWYPGADELGPIASEPYGAVTNRGVAYRQPKEKIDFFTLLDGWILKDQIPPIEQQHYVVACLIRGGVFGESEEKDKDKDKA